jgi:hypothetical protein
MNATVQQQTPETHSSGRYILFSAIAGAISGVISVQGDLPFSLVAPIAAVISGWTAGMTGKPPHQQPVGEATANDSPAFH